MKKILCFILFLNFLISCQISTSSMTIKTENVKKNSKANATFNVDIKNGICNNCE